MWSVTTSRNKSYKDKLLTINLFFLEQRGNRGVMIEVWKILNGKENINRNELFTFDESSITRTNRFKLVGKRFTTEVVRDFFSYRVINEWNKLPYIVVNCQTLDDFKVNLDKSYRSRAQRQAATLTTN
jgi:hypothetical protein